ncbi:WecB/TagA/CpsF family glycosyltransferase [Pseudomonas sp. DWP3-1-2]|uniref:WecB/TagA/CpsF family glycosyltransferase n=1 Tax=Pseudomonas sp. DWP3-1-2 TaxID=2804645 RepID=UPI003CF87A16
MKVFGIEFYHRPRQELIRELIALSDRPFRYIVTPNVDHIVMLEHDGELRRSYRYAAYRLCDSRVLFPLLNRLHANIAEAIPGSTLTQELIQIAEQRRWPVTVIGCEQDIIATLKQKYPSITFHHHNPPMGFIANPLEIERSILFINQHPARMVVFSVGSPRQEILAMRVYERGAAVGIGLCVGASLLFLSGKHRRAPEWIQRLSLEWLHRFLHEPRRLGKRYVKDAYRIIPAIFKEIRNGSGKRPNSDNDPRGLS